MRLLILSMCNDCSNCWTGMADQAAIKRQGQIVSVMN